MPWAGRKVPWIRCCILLNYLQTNCSHVDQLVRRMTPVVEKGIWRVPWSTFEPDTVVGWMRAGQLRSCIRCDWVENIPCVRNQPELHVFHVGSSMDSCERPMPEPMMILGELLWRLEHQPITAPQLLAWNTRIERKNNFSSVAKSQRNKQPFFRSTSFLPFFQRRVGQVIAIPDQK